MDPIHFCFGMECTVGECCRSTMEIKKRVVTAKGCDV